MISTYPGSICKSKNVRFFNRALMGMVASHVQGIYSTWPRADGTTQYWGRNEALMDAVVARFR
jgi:hypothetical protein